MAKRPKQDDPWYFACDCGAKFFHEEQSVECPRCGESLNSPERIRPPWQPRRKLYTLKETAKLLGIGKSWLYANKDRLPHHRLGGIKFSEEDFDEILEESKVEAKPKRDQPKPCKSVRPRPKLRHIKL